MSNSTRDRHLSSKSPSARIHPQNNGSHGLRKSQQIQRVRDIGLSQDKKALMNSLAEHSSALKQKLNAKEKEIASLRKMGSSKIEMHEKNIKTLEARKLELNEKINKTLRELQDLDIEKLDLSQSIQTQNERINELLSQIRKIENEFSYDEKARNDDLLYQYEVQQRYFDMIDDRERDLRESNIRIRQLERQCVDNEVEIAKIQAEIENRYPKIEANKTQNRAAEVNLHRREGDVREWRAEETEEEAEISILLSQKAKRLHEREAISREIEELKITTNNILKKLLDAQMHLELKLNWGLRKFGSRILEITMKRIYLRQLQDTFQLIEVSGCKQTGLRIAFAKLSGIMNSLNNKIAGEALRDIHKSSLNYPKLALLNTELLKEKTKRNLVFYSWMNWRKQFKLRTLKKTQRRTVLEQIINSFTQAKKRYFNNFFSIMKNNQTKHETKIMELHHLLTKKNNKEYHQVFLRWKMFMQRSDIILAKKVYEDGLLETKYLQSCFNKLKDHATKTKRAKFALMRQKFEQWRKEYKLRRRSDGNEVKLETIKQKRGRQYKAWIFRELKNNMSDNKTGRALKESQEKVTQYKQNLHKFQNCENKHLNNVKNHFFRIANIRLKQKLKHYFSTWNRKSIQKSTKLGYCMDILERAFKKSNHHNFQRWKLVASMVAFEETAYFREKEVSHSIELQNLYFHALAMEESFQNRKAKRLIYALERVASKQNRLLLTWGMRKYQDNTRKLGLRRAIFNQGFITLNKLFLRTYRNEFVENAQQYIRVKKANSLANNFLRFSTYKLMKKGFLILKRNKEQRRGSKQTVKRYIMTSISKMLSKRLTLWRTQVKNMKNSELKREVANLDHVSRTKTIELENRVIELEQVKKTGRHFDEKAKEAKSAHIWKLLFQDIYFLKFNALKRWRIRVKEFSQKKTSVAQMLNVMIRNFCRTAFQKTLTYGDKYQFYKDRMTLEEILQERKELKELTRKEIAAFKAKSEAQNGQIQGLETSKDFWTKALEHSNNTISQRFEADVKQHITFRIFKQWKNITKLHKLSCSRIEKALALNITRETFRSLRWKVELSWRQDKQRIILARMGRNIQKKDLDAAFYIWKRDCRIKRKISFDKKYGEMNESLDKTNFYADKIRQDNIDYTMKRFERNLIKRTFTQLAEISSTLKQLRENQASFAKKVKEDNIKNSFRHLYVTLKRNKVKNNMIKNTLRLKHFKLLRVIIYAWREESRRNKEIQTLLVKLQNRLQFANMSHAFLRIKAIYLKQKQIFTEDKKELALVGVKYADLLVKQALKLAFTQFAQNVEEKTLARKQLKKLFARLRAKKISSHFLRWKIKAKASSVVAKSQEMGEMFVTKQKLQREHEYLQTYILDEGYQKEELEHFHSKIQVENYNLMQQAVSRLILNASGLTVVTKALHSWKQYVLHRKKIKVFAQKVLGYRFKSDLMSSFNLWKSETLSEKYEREELTKKELRNRLMAQNNKTSLLIKNANELKQQVNVMENHLETNMRNFDTGKVLAVRKFGRLDALYKKRYFGMLKACSHAVVSAVKVENSDAAAEQIMELQKHISLLESEYKELFKENRVLRTTSLEGLDITNAIQDISSEREKLSRELEAKNITIQKLVNENMHLQTRLSLAQKEAEELIKFTKEFFQPQSTKSSKDSRRNVSNSGLKNK